MAQSSGEDTREALVTRLRAEAGVWDTVRPGEGESRVYDGTPLADLLREAADQLAARPVLVEACRALLRTVDVLGSDGVRADVQVDVRAWQAMRVAVGEQEPDP